MEGKHIMICYTDLAAASSRCCMGIDETAEIFPLDVPELGEEPTVAVVPGEGDKPHPVQIMNYKKEVSCIVVNCNIPARVSHEVANRLLDVVINRGAEQLTVVAALRPDPQHAGSKAAVMMSCINCKAGADGITEIPQDFQVNDPFLNALLSLLKVEELPCRFVVATGYRANKGCPSSEDGSLQTIHNLQNTLSKIYGLKFSSEKTRQLNFIPPEDSQPDAHNMLYM